MPVLVEISETIRARARLLEPVTLRSLELDAVVTYDARLADAGRRAGLRVLSPA